MVIRLEHGKGGKDRYVMLSPQLLRILRAYWRLAKPAARLFPGRQGDRPVSTATLQAACRVAARKAELGKPVTVHTLRHSFATHLQRQRAVRSASITRIPGAIRHRPPARSVTRCGRRAPYRAAISAGWGSTGSGPT